MCCEVFTRASEKDEFSGRPKHLKMDMRFGTWNVRCLYTAGSLKTVARELRMNKLDLVGEEEVRWKKGALKGQRVIRSSMEKGMMIIREFFRT
jgi:hypothetical protein